MVWKALDPDKQRRNSHRILFFCLWCGGIQNRFSRWYWNCLRSWWTIYKNRRRLNQRNLWFLFLSNWNPSKGILCFFCPMPKLFCSGFPLFQSCNGCFDCIFSWFPWFSTCWLNLISWHRWWEFLSKGLWKGLLLLRMYPFVFVFKIWNIALRELNIGWILARKEECFPLIVENKCFKSPKIMEWKEQERDHFTSVDVLVRERGKKGYNF